MAGSATVALADHDWIDGCADGNACFWEGTPWWSEAKSSDHRDANTYADLYYSGKSVGWHTDWVENEMNSTHAHIYRWSNYSSHLGCLDPNDPDELDVRGIETASWMGHSGNC